MLFEPMGYAKKKKKPLSSMEELLRRSGGPPRLTAPRPPQWTPTPAAPFAGLWAYDWKTPSREPVPVGVVREHPRGNPPLSPLELAQWKLNDRKQLEEMLNRFQYTPSHRNF
jgi:hypothetical protein